MTHATVLPSDPTSLDLQQLWFGMLRRRAWSSLAVVPADAETSAVLIARGLATVGERYLGQRLTFIVPAEVTSPDELLSPGTSPLAIAGGQGVDLEAVMGSAEGGIGVAEAVERTIARVVSRSSNRLFAHRTDPGDFAEVAMPHPRVIVALEPVVANPFGIAVALASDAALLCLTLGETRLDSARRTVELIGPERFVGCAVVRRR
jgi:hypothetical protein